MFNCCERKTNIICSLFIYLVVAFTFRSSVRFFKTKTRINKTCNIKTNQKRNYEVSQRQSENKKIDGENRGKDFISSKCILGIEFFFLWWVYMSICQGNLVHLDSENIFIKKNRMKLIQPNGGGGKRNENKQTNKLNGKTVMISMIQILCVWFLLKIHLVFIQNTLRLRIRSKLDLKLLVE